MKNIKLKFEKQYQTKIKRRPKFTGQIFYESNDRVFFWDLPTEQRNNLKGNKSDVKFVNILVANSDYVSICPEIDGDIMITDINKKLLSYINKHTKKIRQLYEKYKSNKIDFDQVKKEIKKFYKKQGSYELYKNRRYALGAKHFLCSEERFNICLESLKNKEIETININLMDTNEQKFLANSLCDENYKINMVNLTNLPDYDADTLLIRFCEKLPMKSNKGLFVLNVHDRGIKKEHVNYDHVLFYTTSINELKKIYSETIPDTFAKYDKMQHGENISDPTTIIKSFFGNQSKTKI